MIAGVEVGSLKLCMVATKQMLGNDAVYCRRLAILMELYFSNCLFSDNMKILIF